MDLQGMLDEANRYFAQLNSVETYAWLALVAGFGLLVVGTVLLFL